MESPTPRRDGVLDWSSCAAKPTQASSRSPTPAPQGQPKDMAVSVINYYVKDVMLIEFLFSVNEHVLICFE